MEEGTAIIIATYVGKSVAIFEPGERYILRLNEFGNLIRVHNADPKIRSSLSFYSTLQFLSQFTDIVTVVADNIVEKAFPKKTLLLQSEAEEGDLPF